MRLKLERHRRVVERRDAPMVRGRVGRRSCGHCAHRHIGRKLACRWPPGRSPAGRAPSRDTGGGRMAAEEHRTIREGIVAGVLGASAVAIWFLILDTASGRPFYTPQMLGASMATFFGAPGTGHPIPLVLGYTLVHFAAFILVGLIVSAVVNSAEGQPSLLIGAAFL